MKTADGGRESPSARLTPQKKATHAGREMVKGGRRERGKKERKKRNEVEMRVRERKYLRDEKKLPYGRILLFNLIFKGLQLSH